LLAIDLVSLSGSDDRKSDLPIMNFGDEAKVANAVFPEPNDFIGLQHVAQCAGIGGGRHAVAQKSLPGRLATCGSGWRRLRAALPANSNFESKSPRRRFERLG
jgi:hypothetical protein